MVIEALKAARDFIENDRQALAESLTVNGEIVFEDDIDRRAMAEYVKFLAVIDGALKAAVRPAPVQPVGVTTGCASHEGFFTVVFRSQQPIPDGTDLYTTPPAAQPAPVPNREQIYKDAFDEGVHEGNFMAMHECRLEYFKLQDVFTPPTAPVQPVACFMGAKGSAFDLPETKRAYTYKEQPGNAVASKLGRACEAAIKQRAGDNIDRGLGLLHELQEAGFGVFALGAEYIAAQRAPDAWMSASRFEELQKGFTVMTTLTKQKAFDDDVAIHATPPAAPVQPVSGVVLRDGYPTLIQDKHIKETDQRLCILPTTPSAAPVQKQVLGFGVVLNESLPPNAMKFVQPAPEKGQP